MADIPFQRADAPALRRRREALLRTRGRRFARTAAGVFCLLALAAGYFARLAAVGLPAAWADRIAEAVSTDAFAAELERVSFSLSSLRLRVGAARLYRRGSLREPVADVRNLQVALRPRFAKPGADWIRAVEIESCDVPVPPEFSEPAPEPAAAEPPPAANAAAPAGGGPADFPAIPVLCRRADILGLSAHGLRARLACRGGRLELDGAAASFEDPREPRQRIEGRFAADLARGAFAADGGGRLDPNKLAGLLEGVGEGGIAEELAKFRFPDEAPEVDARYRYDPAAGERLLRLGLRAGSALYNGVPVAGFSGVVEVSGDGGWSRVRIADLHVERPEGAVDGTLEIATREGRISFRAESTVDPLRAVALIGLLGPDDALPLVCDNPTVAHVEGVYDYGRRGGTNATDLTVTARGPGFSLLGLHLDDISGRMTLRGDTLVATNLAASAFGGTCDAWLRLGVGPDAGAEDGRVWLGGAVRGVSWDRLHAELAGAPPPADGGRGTLEADVSLAAPADEFFAGEFGRAEGSLSLSLRESQVFRIPFFTRLVGLLGDIVPGVDLLMDRDSLALRGALSDGVFAVSKLDIEGTAFSIAGRGRAWTADRSLDLTLDVHLMNRDTWLGSGVYWLMTPLSKIFAVRASGTFDDPKWSSARLTKGKKGP